MSLFSRSQPQSGSGEAIIIAHLQGTNSDFVFCHDFVRLKICLYKETLCSFEGFTSHFYATFTRRQVLAFEIATKNDPQQTKAQTEFSYEAMSGKSWTAHLLAFLPLSFICF